jgi:hypothetical protein
MTSDQKLPGADRGKLLPMATDADIRDMADKTRKIVSECVEEVCRTVVDTGAIPPEEMGAVLEQSVLALILDGLMARAKSHGISWADIQADADIADKARRALPMRTVVQ